MARRGLVGLLTAALMALGITLALLLRPAHMPLVAERVEGDIAERLERTELDDMPALAEAFLATDRPWRAARTMRAWLERTDSASSDRLVLAARAEAGWGGWPEARTLLERVSALDTYDNGVGVYLLARALDETGDARGAVERYREFLALSPPAGELEAERDAARLRLALALIRLREGDAALRELSTATERVGEAGVWLDLLAADALAQTGDTAAVRRAVAAADSGLLGLRAWRARIAAARNAGDIAAVRALANEARAWARTDGTRAEFLVTAARAAIEMGDTARGRAALRSAIELGAGGGHARAAADLLRRGDLAVADHLAIARVYRAQGLYREALDGYRRWLDSGQGSAAERRDVRLEYANSLFWLGRWDDVIGALRPIAGETPARMMHARAEAQRDNHDESVRIYLAVAESEAGSETGRQALFFAANARHDQGDRRAARTLYQRVVERYPGSDLMGLAMMRLAGMAFHDGDYAAAARIWDDYVARYPRGSRVLEATYWAGRAREALGDTAGAADRYRAVRHQDRGSYYAVLASERLRQSFWPVPMGAAPPDDARAARRVAAWMRGIDLLRTAGFHDEASAEADRVVDRAGSDRATLYALAEALAERGYSQRAIRIGLQLQRSEEANRRLLRILYPFPYRTLITEEARDRGMDPFIAAALIRQESLFEARVTSPAGARGLMQIMPATGRLLAEAAGLDRWDAELLYHPEINVHLGIRYLAQHMDNYDGSLPAVFSAYNAGAHRVGWWSRFPEYGRDDLFTERIPFRETRDYVKILTRNHAMYRGLYAEGE